MSSSRSTRSKTRARRSRSGGAALAEEALLRGLVAGQVRQHGLDSDLAAELGVFALEDDAHAAVAKDLENAKTAEPAQFVVGLGRSQERSQAGIIRGWTRVRRSGD